MPELYEEAGRTDALEDVTEALWLRVLQHIFPTEQYFVRQQARIHSNPGEVVDIIITETPWNKKTVTILIVETKRTSKAGQDSAWDQALNQLHRYLKTMYKAAKPKPEIQFGLVAIGRHARFYTQEAEDYPEDYPGTNGKAYHVRDHRVEITNILGQIKEDKKQD